MSKTAPNKKFHLPDLGEGLPDATIVEWYVKEGDVIAVRERSRQLAIVLEAVGLAERDVPDYIDADHNKMTATFVRTPMLGDVPYAVVMEPNLVVEYYAKN